MSAGKVIGLCGGIGSGKSIVSRILRTRGYKVYDCDLEAKNLMASDVRIPAELENRWSKDIFTDDGLPDRRKIADIVFSDPEELAWLNQLVHEAVRTHLGKWLSSCDEYETVYVESAILCSSGLSALCSEIWEITAPEDVRIFRLESRSGMNAAEARSRIKSQEAEDALIRQSEVTVRTIINDGSHSLIGQLAAI